VTLLLEAVNNPLKPTGMHSTYESLRLS